LCIDFRNDRTGVTGYPAAISKYQHHQPAFHFRGFVAYRLSMKTDVALYPLLWVCRLDGTHLVPFASGNKSIVTVYPFAFIAIHAIREDAFIWVFIN
jgi:hypothetical protein